MKLYNTLTKGVQEFIPNNDKEVKLYTCGHTVYHYAHISNLRTNISEDILEKKAKGKTKYEYAFICKLKDGRYGAAVLPVNKLTYYTNRLRQSKVIESMRIVSAPWNETYPLKHLRSSATIKIISRDRYEELSQHKDIKV